MNDPLLDVCTFGVNGPEAIPSLRPAPTSGQIGDEVWVIGFPVDVAQIRYRRSRMTCFSRRFAEGTLSGSPITAIPSDESLLQLGIPLVGGFSGSPLLNMEGEVVGIATFASHKLLQVREQYAARPSLSSTTRLLDPAHVSFAVRIAELEDVLVKPVDTKD